MAQLKDKRLEHQLGERAKEWRELLAVRILASAPHAGDGSPVAIPALLLDRGSLVNAKV